MENINMYKRSVFAKFMAYFSFVNKNNGLFEDFNIIFFRRR